MTGTNTPFLTDVKTLRLHLDQAVPSHRPTKEMSARPSKSCRVFWRRQSFVCCTTPIHSIAATGISSEAVKDEFAENAKEEQEHMTAVGSGSTSSEGSPSSIPLEQKPASPGALLQERLEWRSREPGSRRLRLFPRQRGCREVDLGNRF